MLHLPMMITIHHLSGIACWRGAHIKAVHRSTQPHTAPAHTDALSHSCQAPVPAVLQYSPQPAAATATAVAVAANGCQWLPFAQLPHHERHDKKAAVAVGALPADCPARPGLPSCCQQCRYCQPVLLLPRLRGAPCRPRASSWTSCWRAAATRACKAPMTTRKSASCERRRVVQDAKAARILTDSKRPELRARSAGRARRPAISRTTSSTCL